jgi:hypothetical protein
LYADVVAEGILQVTEIIDVDGFHVIRQIGDGVVTPVTEFVILQNNCVVPATPPPVTVVEELNGVFIVEALPVVCHK